MRVRAAGSSGVTTVNAVQTTVKRGRDGKGGDDQRKEKYSRDRLHEKNQCTQKHEEKKEDWTRKRSKK